MAYRFVEHTGEIEVELAAGSEADIFEAALAAFADLVDAGPGGAPVSHRVELTGADHGLLLVDWLNELVFLAEVAGFVPERIASFELTDGRLRATRRQVAATIRATWSRRPRSTSSRSSRREVGGMRRVVLDV